MSEADEIRGKFGRMYDDTIKHLEQLCAITVQSIERDPSHKNFFALADIGMKLTADGIMSANINQAMAALFSVKLFLRVLKSNPMFDSPALALQTKHAAASILETYTQDRDRGLDLMIQLFNEKRAEMPR